MKYLNKLSILVLIILIIAIPIAVITLNRSTNKQIEANAQNAKNYAKTSAEVKENTQQQYQELANQIPGIVCIGSDLMLSNSTGTKFVSQLDNKLKEGYKTPIVNLAVSGENNLTILGRLGIKPFLVAEDIAIPSSGGLLEMKIKSSSEGNIWPLAVSSENNHINPVIIDGHSGMLGGESIKDPSTGENKHYFVRNDTDGPDYVLKANTPIQTSCQDAYRDYVHIIWIGENDTWTDYNALADDIQSIVDHGLKNRDNYIVMGLISGNNETMKEYDKIMEKRFGKNFVNVRKVLSTIDLVSTKADYDQNDKAQQSQGQVPNCFFNSNGTLNDEASRQLASHIYNVLDKNIYQPKLNELK